MHRSSQRAVLFNGYSIELEFNKGRLESTDGDEVSGKFSLLTEYQSPTLEVSNNDVKS